ncbi:MAG: hypothetical protein WBJ83_07115 [Thermacetogeniaceae bacterium]|jgi:phage gp29-like protein
MSSKSEQAHNNSNQMGLVNANRIPKFFNLPKNLSLSAHLSSISKMVRIGVQVQQEQLPGYTMPKTI